MDEKHGTGECHKCPNHTQDCPRNRCVEYKALDEKRRLARKNREIEKHHPATEYLYDYHKRIDANELKKGKKGKMI